MFPFEGLMAEVFVTEWSGVLEDGYYRNGRNLEDRCAQAETQTLRVVLRC